MKIVKASWVSHDGMPIFSVDIHPDNSRFVTGGQGTDSGLVIIWNLKPVISKEAELDGNTPKMLCQLDSHLACVNCVRWSTSGKYLASAGDDKLTMIWKLTKYPLSGSNICFGSKDKVNVETWRCINTLRGHSGDILDIAWSPEDVWLATASVDNTVIIWDATKLPTIVTVLKEHTGLVKGVAWDPIGKYLSTQSEDKSLRIWRTFDWKLETAIRKPFKNCSGMTEVLRHSWSPDGQYVITAHAMNETAPTSQILERDGWKYEKDFVGHKKAITCAKFSGNIVRKKLKHNNDKEQHMCVCALGSRDSGISVWLTGSLRPTVALQEIFEGPVLDLSWSSDGGYLFGCSFDGSIVTMIFNDDEIGKPLSREQRNELFEKMYGTSTIGYRKQDAHIIENPDLLHLLEESNKRERKNNLERNDKISFSTPSFTTPTVARLQTPARIITTKQVETRTKDGKRRITPIYIPPVMDEDDEQEMIVTPIDEAINIENSRMWNGDKDKVDVIKMNDDDHDAVIDSTDNEKEIVSNTKLISANETTTLSDSNSINKIISSNTTTTTTTNSCSVDELRDQNMSENTPSITTTMSSKKPFKESTTPDNTLVGYKRKILNDSSSNASAIFSPSADVAPQEKKLKVDNTDESFNTTNKEDHDRPMDTTETTIEENNKNIEKPFIDNSVETTSKQSTTNKNINNEEKMLNDIEVQFQSVLERTERGDLNSSVSKITPTIAQNIKVFNNIFLNSRKTAMAAADTNNTSTNCSTTVSEQIDNDDTNKKLSSSVGGPGCSSTGGVCSTISGNVATTEKDNNKYGGKKPSSTAVNLLAAKRPKFMDKMDNYQQRDDVRNIVNEISSSSVAVKLPRMRLNVPTTISITSRHKLLISSEVGFKVNNKFFRIKLKIDNVLSWEYAYGYEVIGCSFNDKMLAIALSNRYVHLLELNSGKMISPPIILSSPTSVLLMNGVYLVCITCDGVFNMWNTRNSIIRAVITGQSLASILTPAAGKEEVIVKKVTLSPDGIPMLLLSTGNSFLFSEQIQSWISIGNNNDPVTLCSLQRVRQNNVRAIVSDITRLPLFTLQSYASFATSSGNGGSTLAQNSNMADVCTVTFLEQQLASSIALKSTLEYRYWLLTLVRFLLQHGKLQRLRSICEELLGPLNHSSSTSSSSNSSSGNTITMLGLNKHVLLKDVLKEIGSNIHTQRLFTEFNDQLNSIISSNKL